MEETEWKKSLLKIFEVYGILFRDEVHKEMVSQEIQFLSARYRGYEDQERDEALWTEYAKASLQGAISNSICREAFGYSLPIPEVVVGFSEKCADTMLTAHKKRWGYE